MPVINRTPYRNLILTGTMGVGKTGVGRALARQMEGAEFIDVETEIQAREGHTPEYIRETFGAARLRSIESKLVQEITLRRSTIIAVSGSSLADQGNLERLQDTGPILCLTAALGEILRRLHVSQGGWFHQPDNRAGVLGRLKRERQVLSLGLAQVDTTGLKIEEVAQKAIEFWMTNADM